MFLKEKIKAHMSSIWGLCHKLFTVEDASFKQTEEEESSSTKWENRSFKNRNTGQVLESYKRKRVNQIKRNFYIVFDAFNSF